MSRYPIATVVHSHKELNSVINQVRNLRGPSPFNEIYRGQGRDCWKLIPKVARQITDPLKIKMFERKTIQDFFSSMKSENLLNTISSGSNKGEYESYWLLIQQAQHFGVPTRFLDWSGKWEVALCFAVADEFDDKYDGQFWIYIVPPTRWVSDENSGYLNVNPFEFKETVFLNSASFFSQDALIQIALRRKGTQMGRFCIQPYSKVITPLENQDEHKPYLHKIIIPANFKKSIREELRLLGITKDACMVSEPQCKKDRAIYHETIEKINKIVQNLPDRYIEEG